MSYRITLKSPIPAITTEQKLTSLSIKIFDYGSAKFFSYKDKYFELEEDRNDNVVGLTIHGDSAADFRSLMRIKDKIFLDR